MLPLKNKCFAAIPVHIREALRPHLKLAEVPKGVTLASLTREPTLYFPITCVLAITATATSQRGSFLRFAGTEVAIGLQRGGGYPPMQSEAVVCGGGHVFSVPSLGAWNFLSSPSVLKESYHDLIHAIASRALICSFCASNHSISQRLFTMLLSAEDEFGVGRQLSLSQAQIASWMFVRRESIANMMAELSGLGMIDTGRSKITIRDRNFLSERACSCYHSAKSQSDLEFSAWESLRWKDEEVLKKSVAQLRAVRKTNQALAV
jgi:hypothetical protein